MSSAALADPTIAAGEKPARPFPCFDGLRAIAAMAILLLHVASSTGATTATFWGDYFARLDVGVAVFFVISGFLLYRPFAVAHLGGPPTSSWTDFWWRRALRIYPAYWVALTAAIVLFHSTNLHGFADYLRHYALVQIYTPGFGLGGIVPTWSLAVEVSFYAALPIYAWLLGWLAKRGSSSRALTIELSAAAFLYALGLGVRTFLFYHDRPGTASAQWLPAEADLFALGIALAVFSAAATTGVSTRRTNWVARVLRWLGEHQYVSWILSATAFAIVCNIGLEVFFGVGAYHRKAEMAHQILYGLTAFFLVLPAVFGNQYRGVGRWLLRSRAFTAVGVVSYGVFLWHFDWIAQLGDWGLIRNLHALRFPIVLGIALPLTFASATLSWFLVERPALRRKRHPWQFGRKTVMGMVALAYAAARIVPMVGGRPWTVLDTTSYYASSHASFLSKELWFGPRPPLYPVLAKIVVRTDVALVVIQMLVATVAWLALAWYVYTRVRNRPLAVLAAFVVLFASLALDVVQWDLALLTESLTLSLAVLLFVVGALFVESPSRCRGIGLVALAAAWVLLRDSNGYVVLCVAAAFLVGMLFERSKRRAFRGVAVGLVLVFAFGVVSSNIGYRWTGPLKDVITMRALVHPDRTQYMLDRGMPLSAAERKRIQGLCVARVEPGYCLLLRNPPFYHWVRTNGRAAYSGWIRSHPGTALADPIRNSGELFGPRLPVDQLTGYKFAPADFAERIFFVRNQKALLAEALIGALLVLYALRRRASALAWTAFLALATTYPHMFVIWSFGSLDTQRHALAASLILRLGVILAAICAVDAAVAPRGDTTA